MTRSAQVALVLSLVCVASASLDPSSRTRKGHDSGDCEDKPTLTCFLVATTSEIVTGKISQVAGKVQFNPITLSDCGVCGTRINGTITGLTPNKHGWHVHEKGDISGPTGLAAGGHFNPFGTLHGLPEEKSITERHAGDLGNLITDKSGVAKFDIKSDVDTAILLGRALIIHELEDDGGQPTGNAGARLAQCVLGRLDLSL